MVILVKIIKKTTKMGDQIGYVNASTRAAEGFFNGLKFSVVHALLYSPFYSKAEALETGRSFWPIYLRKSFAACFFYSGILGATFGMRHFASENKDRLRFDLQYNLPVIRDYPIV